jgi:hypothetical protein
MSSTRETPDASTSADTREKAARLFTYLRELAKPWMQEVVGGILAGQERAWLDLFGLTTDALDGLMERARQAHGREVMFPDEHNAKGLLADARELYAHLESGHGLGHAVSPHR